MLYLVLINKYSRILLSIFLFFSSSQASSSIHNYCYNMVSEPIMAIIHSLIFEFFLLCNFLLILCTLHYRWLGVNHRMVSLNPDQKMLEFQDQSSILLILCYYRLYYFWCKLNPLYSHWHRELYSLE